MSGLVRAKGYFREMPVITVQEGELWDADDPVVNAHPDWFETLEGKPLRVAKPAIRSASPVEQATASPGERRITRRPSQ